MSESYHCCLCIFSSSSIRSYVWHWKLHSNIHHVNYPCAVPTCKQKFSTFSAFESHVFRNHLDLIQKKQNHLEPNNLILKCSLSLCAHINFTDHITFIAHIKRHIDAGIKITCPYTNCISSFTKKSSFTSHISRCHRSLTALDSIGNQFSDDIESENTEIDLTFDSSEPIPRSSLESNFMPDNILKLNLMKDLALFYLKLQSKHLVPCSTIQQINEEITKLSSVNINIISDVVAQKLADYSISNTEKEEITNMMKHHNFLFSCNSSLFISDYKRLQYYKQNFHYVEPTECFLGKNNFDKCCYSQYISIKDTLKSIFSKPEVIDLCEVYSIKKQSNGDTLQDINDGNIFKENKLFNENPDYLSIILFQDAFEVVNPLGSAKKKHKVIGIYFTLSNFPPFYRSNIDNIQLVLLCRESDFKYFGQKVLSPLVSHLKEIETKGILINDKFIKGTVTSVVGDNLGSHFIGGFVESFNCEFFCRYCLITQNEFKSKPFVSGAVRTPDSYKSSLNAAAETDREVYQGIKFDSSLNELDYFHVCQPGLPPCLGHDLFEGVVSYDLILYIQYFIKIKKWLTYSQLNHAILHFPYDGNDSRNKPNVLDHKTSKINGHAVQNWCFLKLLPLLIGNFIKNKDDDVWALCLSLREIVELVCAPKIKKEQLYYLQCIIDEYLELRLKVFPDVSLKPKHHYLYHYPLLIFKLGPLIRLWTLRFESKHSYFKRCARQCRNFKNLCQTLALRHQLLQCYIHAGNLFLSPVIINKRIEFHADVYNFNVQESLKKYKLAPDNTIASYNVSIYGITYKKNLFLPIKKTDHVVFGKILLILVKNNNIVHFVVDNIPHNLVSDLGIYCQDNSEYVFSVTCIDMEQLLDYYPLPGYVMNKMHCICLHHAII